MPDRRRHRGPHPEDARLFGAAARPALRLAVADLSLLLGRGYAERSALKLVGDRYRLAERQRTAVARAACSDAALAGRRARALPLAAASGRPLVIDGYNLLITVESALSGAFLFEGRDGALRDLAGLHGSYRLVEETLPAVRLIGAFLEALRPAAVRWLLDAPVSNSGRLKGELAREAARAGWPWSVELAQSPDPVLAKSDDAVVSTDSWVLDRAPAWLNLAALLVSARLPETRVVRMGDEG